MLDAALFYAQKAEQVSNALKRYNLAPGSYILATIHRAENTDDREKLLAIIKGLSQASKDLPVVFPVHPRTECKLMSLNFLTELDNRFQLIKPLGYLDMIILEKNAALIATDSGGVQKEAYFYQVPCVTIRDETEWVELVDSGWNYVCPPKSSDSIYNAIKNRLGSVGISEALYGDGKAANKIAKKISQ
jgi:UDP-GlcNAc3NAcA epimerase